MLNHSRVVNISKLVGISHCRDDVNREVFVTVYERDDLGFVDGGVV